MPPNLKRTITFLWVLTYVIFSASAAVLHQAKTKQSTAAISTTPPMAYTSEDAFVVTSPNSSLDATSASNGIYWMPPPHSATHPTGPPQSSRTGSPVVPSAPKNTEVREAKALVSSLNPSLSQEIAREAAAGGRLSVQDWELLRFSDFEASMETALSAVQSPACKTDTRLFLRHLRNLTLWATQIFDASVKYPLGVLSGNVYNMGDFDECLSVKGPSDIEGKYCLAKVDIIEPPSAKEARRQDWNGTEVYSIWLDPLTSMWEQIEFKGDRSKHRKDSAYWAMCVPSSCTALDVEMAMGRMLPPLASEMGIDLKVNVHPQFCTAGLQNRFTAGDWGFCAVVLLIVSLAISATFCDVYCRNALRGNGAGALYLCFSMRKNFTSLSKLSSNEDGLRIMFGIRVLSMIMVIMCHKYGVTIGGATTNGQYIEEGNRETPYMLTLHGDLVVDTFFTVGAFLLAYSGLKDSESKRVANIAVMYLIRYIRLTPAYALVLFFYATLLNRMGSGPLWHASVTPESDFCAKNWWTNLLYVSNYVNTEEMCMVQSWYLPCDMHYFVIGASILVLLRRSRILGHVALVVFATAAVAVPFAVTLAGKHDATLLFYRDFLSNPRASRYFQAMYIRTHTRAGPYVAGFIAGYLFYRYRLFEEKMSKFAAYWMFLMSLIISGAVLFSCIVFYTPSTPYDAWEAASYAGLQRFAWGVSVSLLICALASGHIGFVSSILCWTPFVALGKLTYCAYLLHFIFQLIGLGGDRNPNYVTNYNVFLKSTGESVFTFSVALVLHLMVEAPFRDLGRALIRGRRSPRKQPEENGARIAK